MAIQHRLALLGVGLGIAGACCVPLLPLPASAQAVVAPGSSVDGVSHYEWSTRWWTAAGEAPLASNPLLGASDSASLGLINDAPRSPVYFLTGTVDGVTVNRSATIASNQYIFFSPLNYLEWQSFGSGFPDAAAVCDSAKANIDNTTINSIYATLDSSPLVTDISNYRQSCVGQPNIPPLPLGTDPLGTDGAFQANAEPGSLFEDFGTSDPDLFASDGYWLMLKPLAAGTYQLKFGGVFNDGAFVQDNTYTLNVKNPSVPGPLPVLGAAAALGYSRKLRKRLKSSRRPGARANS
jgi:hypothetical protein